MRIDTSTPENLHVTLSPHMFWPSDMQDPCRGLLGRLAPHVWVPDMHNLWGGHHQIHQIRISPCVWTSDTRDLHRGLPRTNIIRSGRLTPSISAQGLHAPTKFACHRKFGRQTRQASLWGCSQPSLNRNFAAHLDV